MAFPINADGEFGEHVKHLSDNLERYSAEVTWLIEEVDGIVDRYEQGGAKAAGAGVLLDHWEAVDFHSAIETSYLPVYAAIWQGLYGVKDSIDRTAPIASVRNEQAQLKQALWQALGAVKLASQYQDLGLLDRVQLREEAPTHSVASLSEIKIRLNRVVAKYAEQLHGEAVNIVHDTYLNVFEGLEGELIAQDAELVEDLEKDFNVTLPKAIEDQFSIEEVRQVVASMHGKLDLARSLLEQAQQEKTDVF